MNVSVDPKNHEAKLPAAVIRNAQAADEMQRNLINPPPGDPPPGDPPPGDPPPGDPPLDPNAAPPAPPPDPTDDGTWKHKFNSMQGRYNADTARLRGQIDALSAQVTNLNTVLGSVRAPSAPEETFRPAPATKLRISDEERAEYGEDFIDFASRLAAQEVIRATGPLYQELEKIKQQVGGVGETLHQNDRQRLLSSLDNELPGWRDINSNQEYLDWLSLQDAYTGAIRQELLNEAFEQNNLPRVAAFFKGFLAELAATANPLKGVEPENKGITVPKIALNTIVAPGRAKSAAATPPGAPPEKPIFKPTDVAKFYNDKVSGKFKGREAEANEIEASIIAAGNEGRIRP